ncbi:peroxisomal (S)-2-hydroxy-acid oxidase GLO2 [Striga asiatica]|uniref:Peroxisomal (S)-2-hydroxy-acid oxidase GLO2 n=1 Tax=Striga asiatica TaxID=4170 RepID=A0A5A7QYG6_STRAF|nr:peroxisomal (S)-2-hydroxy-acid oxidase GLO2 [Striga asiatica]
MPIRVKNPYIKNPDSVHVRNGKTRGPIIARVEIVRDELLKRRNLAKDSIFFGILPVVQAVIHVEYRMSDLDEGSWRDVREMVVIEKISSHLTKTGLTDPNRTFQTGLPEGFSDKALWIVRSKGLLVSGLHNGHVFTSQILEIVRAPEPTVYRDWIDTVFNRFNNLFHNLFGFGKTGRMAQYLDKPVLLVMGFRAHRGKARALSLLSRSMPKTQPVSVCTKTRLLPRENGDLRDYDIHRAISDQALG